MQIFFTYTPSVRCNKKKCVSTENTIFCQKAEDAKNNKSNEILQATVFHKSSESQANYGSREISESIAGSLSWNLKAAGRGREDDRLYGWKFPGLWMVLEMGWGFSMKKISRKPERSLHLTVHVAWTAEVCELKARMLWKRKREREVVDIHKTFFLENSWVS